MRIPIKQPVFQWKVRDHRVFFMAQLLRIHPVRSGVQFNEVDEWIPQRGPEKRNCNHQEFQVPKMEVLNLIAGDFWGGGSQKSAVSIQLI